eukprot:9178582-Pyramimonas_sp.AAC.1
MKTLEDRVTLKAQKQAGGNGRFESSYTRCRFSQDNSSVRTTTELVSTTNAFRMIRRVRLLNPEV